MRNIEKAAIYDKQRFDRNKARLNKLSVGEFVLIENEERNQTKLDPKFRGPFKIIEILDGDRYTLKVLNSRRTDNYTHVHFSFIISSASSSMCMQRVDF